MSVLAVQRGRSRGPSRFSRTRRAHRNPLRLLAALVVAALVGTVSIATGMVAAHAASNEPPVFGHGPNNFYAYLQQGESLQTEGNISNVTDPNGTVVGSGEGVYGPADTDGVWTVHSPGLGANQGYDWRVDAQGTEGNVIPGRVWTNQYGMAQTSAGTTDLQFWVVNDTGYLYEIDLYNYNGINSIIEANSFGVADADCAPTYRSHEGYPSSACGDTFRIFFEPPAPDLPETAQSGAGEVFVLPEVLTVEDLTVSGLSFAPTGAGSAAGTFSWSMTERYNGAYWLEIDVDGDGTYDGERDRRILMGADGSGAYDHAFDGLDGQGNAASMCTEMNARVHFDKLGEVHVLQRDVEARVPGIEITRMNGANAPDSTIYWDDTELALDRANETPQVDGTAGVDSTGGVHGWAYDINSWGNNRTIDDWTYLPIDHAAEQITFGGSCLEIEKTSSAAAGDRPGDVVSYSITATNTGDADYTEADPAVVLDDLSGVLDDGELDVDSLAADADGDLGVTGALISWAGPLAAGESVTISYDVTLAAGGDGSVRNVAWEPFNPGDPTPPECDPATDEGRDPVTGEPCASTEYLLPRATVTKTADQSELPVAGTDVTYTIEIASEGPGDFTEEFPASFTDDLSDVLDDADFDEDSIAASTGAAALDGEELSWSGALAAGEVATVNYTVTYTAAGDGQLDNQVCIPVEDAVDPAEACDVVMIPGARLDWDKSVDPDSGTPVEAGEELTYTLSFTNTGTVPATVDTTDDLSGVLDDAELVDGPTAQDGLEISLTEDEVLQITGAVPAGETRTVTYTVVVADLTESEGDGVLENALACPAGAPEDCEPQITENPVRALTVDKSADPAGGVDTGDVVTYTITVTNTGQGDYTQDSPAVVIDDMTGVLDDAIYSEDAQVTPAAGQIDWSAPELTWTGPLAAGQSVDLTYSVQITNLGDHVLQNSAGPVCATGVCQPPVDVEVPLPYITPAKESAPESGTDVQAGDEVTYTLTWTNTGQAAGDVAATDDLSAILDDALVTGGPEVTEGDLDVSLENGALRIEGVLEPGETAAVSYTVTVLPDGERGDNVLANVLVPDVPQVECAQGECTSVPPPSTEHPIGELETSKSVDPASGTTVQPGAEVTYTLTFASTGQAPVAVDHEDILTGVLDDADLVDGPNASDAVLELSGPGPDDRIGITGELQAGQTETVTYTVLVLADGERGDDRLGNFLVNSGAEEPEDCLPEDAHCTVNHVSDLAVAKTSDPESGSTVQAGAEVTYTVTFTNTSTNPDADPAAVDYTDHLADVLDDATLTTGPSVTGDGVQAALDGETIVITGAVAPGESIAVVYTVTVDEAPEGNQTLGNVVAPTGEEPVCAEGSPLCTTHDVDVPPADAGLPGTGVNPAVIAATALLLLTTGLLLAGHRRQQTVRA